uniref:DEAD-box helicase 31 n=1 Tax=Sphenodon punctatus TaxID=8508 RepID=A0A8D0HFL1_SPHPU
MAADEGLILNVSYVPPPKFQHPPGHKRSPRSQTGKEKWQLKTFKRKSQWSDEGIPSKWKHKPPSPPIEKHVKESGSDLKGNGSFESSPKKHLADKVDESLSSRPFVKTSSLFRNNPEIPEINRAAVKQVQEKVFTSDSFSQMELHPHLVSAVMSLKLYCCVLL